MQGLNSSIKIGLPFREDNQTEMEDTEYIPVAKMPQDIIARMRYFHFLWKRGLFSYEEKEKIVQSLVDEFSL